MTNTLIKSGDVVYK